MTSGRHSALPTRSCDCNTAAWSALLEEISRQHKLQAAKRCICSFYHSRHPFEMLKHLAADHAYFINNKNLQALLRTPKAGRQDLARSEGAIYLPLANLFFILLLPAAHANMGQANIQQRIKSNCLQADLAIHMQRGLELFIPWLTKLFQNRLASLEHQFRKRSAGLSLHVSI